MSKNKKIIIRILIAMGLIIFIFIGILVFQYIRINNKYGFEDFKNCIITLDEYKRYLGKSHSPIIDGDIIHIYHENINNNDYDDADFWYIKQTDESDSYYNVFLLQENSYKKVIQKIWLISEDFSTIPTEHDLENAFYINVCEEEFNNYLNNSDDSNIDIISEKDYDSLFAKIVLMFDNSDVEYK